MAPLSALPQCIPPEMGPCLAPVALLSTVQQLLLALEHEHNTRLSQNGYSDGDGCGHDCGHG